MDKPKQKIAFFANSLKSGGIGMVMYHLAGKLADEGMDVDIVLVRRVGAYLHLFENKKFNIIDLDCRGANPFPIKKFSNYLKESNPYAVISMGGFRNSIAAIAKYLSKSKTRLIITEHSFHNFTDMNPDSSFLKRICTWILYRVLSTTIYRFINTIVCVSTYQARLLERILFLKKGKMKVIYNPVVTDELIQKGQMPVTHPWLDGKNKVILAAGRLHPQKNFPLLLKAFQEVRKKRECKLIILGEGTEKEKLIALAESLNIKQDVDMAGFVDNPYAYMHKADVFVLSSEYEPFGLVLVEAMVSGCQVVAVNCPGGIGEILDNGNYGVLVEPNNVAALADAISEVLNGKKTIPQEKLISRAKEFSVDTAVAKYKQLLGL